MKNRSLVLALLLVPTACSLPIGQANMSGTNNNNACCNLKEFIVISNNGKGENTVVSSRPSASNSPTATPSDSFLPIPISTPTPTASPTVSVSPSPSPSS